MADLKLEQLVRERPNLDICQDRLADLLDELIDDQVKKDENLGDAILRHIRWRLGLPERAIKWPPQESSYVPMPRNQRITLAGPSQLECLFDWFKVELDLWTDQMWRDCMLIRYDRRPRTPLEWLTDDVKRRLDRLITESKAKGPKSEQGDEWIGQVAKIISEKQGTLSLMGSVAVQYVGAELDDISPNPYREILDQPTSNGEFFRLIASRATEQKKKIVGVNIGGVEYAPQFSDEEFLRYLIVPEGHELELAGRVLYYLIRLSTWSDDLFQQPIPSELEDIWPGVRISDAYSNLPSLRRYCEALSETLTIDLKVLNHIGVAFISMWMGRALSRQWDGSGSVFWAAQILEALDPDRCRSYRDWIRYLQSRLREERSGNALPTGNESHTATLTRAMLSADPLLNCVFHSDIYQGPKRTGGTKIGPIIDSALINATLSYASLEVLDHLETTPKSSVIDVLSKLDSLPRDLEILMDREFWDLPESFEVGPRSVYSFVTPIAIILFGHTGNQFTPSRVKSRCHANSHLPDVVAFRKDWFEHSKSLIRWNPSE